MCLLAAIAIIATIGNRIFAAAIPQFGGWPIYTPLNGVVLAILLLSPRKLWPWILLGYLAAISQGQIVAGEVYRPSAWVMAGNCLELMIAAFALPPFRTMKQWLLEPRLLRAFAAYALFLGPVVMCLTVTHLHGSPGGVSDPYASVWERLRIVVFAESLGIAFATPLVLVLCDRNTYKLFRWPSLPETVGLLVLLGSATWYSFTQEIRALTFLPYAILLVIVFRLNIRGAVFGTSVVCGVVTVLARLDHDSLLAAGGQAVPVRSYLALAAMVVLPLGVTLIKSSVLEDKLWDAQGELDRLKSLDKLTGVANRRRFDLVLSREWQRASRDPKPIALLMIEPDYFDLYVESHGLEAGNECLRKLAAKIANQPHRASDLISRYEAGKFSVLLPGASGDAVRNIAEEFRATIAALEWPHPRSSFQRVTISVGWAAIVPDRDLQPEALIAAAEQALTSARAMGGNQVAAFPSVPVVASPTVH